MAVSPKSVDLKLIRRLSPLDTLSMSKVEEVLGKSALQNVPAGKVLFKQGDRDKWTVYLLSGEIELATADTTEHLKAGESRALRPLSSTVPRANTATAKTNVSVLIIDTDLFNVLIDWKSSSNSIEVSDFGDDDDEDDDDWMSRFLQSNAFIQLPASNMQALLMKLEEVPLSKGKMVIREGDIEDQNYYIIKQGQCIVSRIDPKSGKQKPLAILKSGVGFGEEALITGTKRGATVSMKNDGIVLKLSKDDFINLLVKPLIHVQNKAQIDDLMASGVDVNYVDVRDKSEHLANGIENSLHCPIRDIRDFFPSLDPDCHYVIYSNSEHRASTAAFLFIQQSFEATVLRDGVGKPDPELLEKYADEDEQNVKIPPPVTETSPATETVDDGSPQSPQVDNIPDNKDIAYYKEQLTLALQAKAKAETLAAKLKQELVKTRELAQKESTIAKNAVQLLRKAEAKIKSMS